MNFPETVTKLAGANNPKQGATICQGQEQARLQDLHTLMSRALPAAGLLALSTKDRASQPLSASANNFQTDLFLCDMSTLHVLLNSVHKTEPSGIHSVLHMDARCNFPGLAATSFTLTPKDALLGFGFPSLCCFYFLVSFVINITI